MKKNFGNNIPLDKNPSNKNQNENLNQILHKRKSESKIERLDFLSSSFQNSFPSSSNQIEINKIPTNNNKVFYNFHNIKNDVLQKNFESEIVKKKENKEDNSNAKNMIANNIIPLKEKENTITTYDINSDHKNKNELISKGSLEENLYTRHPQNKYINEDYVIKKEENPNQNENQNVKRNEYIKEETSIKTNLISNSNKKNFNSNSDYSSKYNNNNNINNDLNTLSIIILIFYYPIK